MDLPSKFVAADYKPGDGMAGWQGLVKAAMNKAVVGLKDPALKDAATAVKDLARASSRSTLLFALANCCDLRSSLYLAILSCLTCRHDNFDVFLGSRSSDSEGIVHRLG